MTTNETFFFRDKIPFDHLRETVLPELMRARANAAPCASGARLPPPGRSRIRSRCA
jgi:chemotaxis methyl-accepting protein methylase